MRATGPLLAALLLASCAGLHAQGVLTILRQKEAEVRRIIATEPPIKPNDFGGLEFQAALRRDLAIESVVTATDDKTNDEVVHYLLNHRSELSGFAGEYVSAYTDKLLRAGNGEKLRYLFTNFDGFIDGTMLGGGERMDCLLTEMVPDGILIYFDVTLISSSAISRGLRTSCLRCDFPVISKDEKSDADFLRMARTWYLANKARLKVNTTYTQSTGPQGYPDPDADAVGLFIPKN